MNVVRGFRGLLGTAWWSLGTLESACAGRGPAARGPGRGSGDRCWAQGGGDAEGPGSRPDALGTPSLASETPFSGSGPRDSVPAGLELFAGALAVFVWLVGLSIRRTCGVPALADRAPKVYHVLLGACELLRFGAVEGMAWAI